jgi:hypothetical protein
MASGPVCRANRPNTWLHRPAMRREDFPCQLGEPSTHGTKLTFANVYSFVLFRGEADMHGPLALPAPVANDP